METHKTLRNT